MSILSLSGILSCEDFRPHCQKNLFRVFLKTLLLAILLEGLNVTLSFFKNTI